jgi:hypothetical protein
LEESGSVPRTWRSLDQCPGFGGVWISAHDLEKSGTVPRISRSRDQCPRLGVAVECRQVDVLRFFFRVLGVLVRVLDVLEFFFRGLGVLVRVLEVLEFFVPTDGCNRMSASRDFWRLDSEIKLGKMALKYKGSGIDNGC